MSPLLVADPRTSGWRNDPAWHQFRDQLHRAKTLGIRAISVDVWWGLVQPSSSTNFEWGYYEAVFGEIIAAGLQVAPILSTHRCGGNVGDTIYIPLPPWFVEKMARGNALDLRSKSEAGNWNDEVASVFADEFVLEDYKRFWSAFRDHFAAQAPHMSDILIGMGPAGELVYPSYHLHDRSSYYEPAHFPNQGSMQAASPLALAKFDAWVREDEPARRHTFRPPTTPEQADALLAAAYAGNENAARLFHWYHRSLLDHGMRMGAASSEVFHGTAGAAWDGVKLGFKIPGIHWRYYDRSAQLKAGWLEFSGPRSENGVPNNWHKDQGGGFATAFEHLILPLRKKFPRSQWQTVFTCAELENCWQSCHTQGKCHCDFKAITGAADLVGSMGTLADFHHAPFVLENALAGSLWSPRNVAALRSQLEAHAAFQGATMLRLPDVVASPHVNYFLQHPPERSTRRCSLLLSAAGADDSQPK